jgi:hypothetical protein
MKIEYKCSVCGKICKDLFGLTSHINRKKDHNLTTKEYFDKYLKKDTDGICKLCGKDTKYKDFITGYNEYCSEKCLMNSEEMKEKIRVGMKNSKSYQKTLKSDDYHKHLSEGIKNSDYIKTTVKTKEYRDNMSKSVKNSEKHKKSHNTPEYLKNLSERTTKAIKEGKMSSKYKYDDILFFSKPEVAYYIWLKNHNIDFKYQNKTLTYEFDGKIKTYIPDFEVEGELVEIKGLHFFEDKDPNKKMINPYKRNDEPEKVKYRDDLMEAKHQCMIKNNVKIITDFTIYMNYIYENFGENYLEMLIV